MLRPGWPTVSVQAVGQGQQPTDAAGNPITVADATQYAAWLDTWQSIPVPVEDGSDLRRSSFASIDSEVPGTHDLNYCQGEIGNRGQSPIYGDGK